MKKDPRIYLAQILERIVRIQDFTCVDKQSFLTDLCYVANYSLENYGDISTIA